MVKGNKHVLWDLWLGDYRGWQRFGLHIAFWVVFTLYHLSYFVPALAEHLLNWRLVNSYTIHYLRLIPVYYLTVAVYDRLESCPRWFAMLCTAIVLITCTHLATAASFALLDACYGLEQLSQAFQMVGYLYLKPLSERHGADWLLFFYDLQEMQLLILPVGIKMVRYGIRQRLQRQQQENLRLKSELKRLQNQLSPHFVFNVLNAAYAEIMPLSPKAAAYLDSLAALLRATLRQSNADWIELSAEFDILNRYTELERIRFGSQIDVSITRKGKFNKNQNVLPLILLTLVENAYKYCDADHGHLWIRIALHIHDDHYQAIIKNSVSLYSPSVHGLGLGLNNLRERLQILFKESATLLTAQHETHFTVILTCPFYSSLS